MKDAGFIFASYLITVGAILIYAIVNSRRARKLSGFVNQEDKPWT